jgi:hypothetical protein
MRIRSSLAVALLVLAPLAACGGDDDSAAATTTTTTEGSDGHPTTTTEVDADVQARAEQAQLEVADLGDGWTLTKTTPPDQVDDTPNPVDECVGDLKDRIDASQVFETDHREFTAKTDAPVPATVQSSSIAVDDPSLFAEMHDLLRGDEFGQCMGTAFQKLLEGNATGAEITIGDVIAAEQVVDPGDDPDLTSTGVTIPVTVSAEGTTLDLESSMTFISTGPVASVLIVFTPTGIVTADAIAEWGRVLAERLAA